MESAVIAPLLRQTQASLAALSAVIGELADQVEHDQNARRPDFLTEAEMAAHLGISKSALQSRRYRGDYPPGIWQKVSGGVVYSLNRYEDWLESIWVHARPIVTYKKPEPTARKKPRPGNPHMTRIV